MSRRRPASARLDGLRQAWDALAFAPDRTLNLRAHLPTRAQAVARCEAWLRERQAAGAGEVLIVTGRGQGSVDGVSVVRQGVLELLSTLSRRHVVASYREHTPGSLVVELAPFAAAHAARRPAPPPAPPPPDPRTLRALSAETRGALRTLAVTVLQHLGVHSPTRTIVEAEMLAQFTRLAVRLPEGAEREPALRAEIQAALEAAGA